MYRDDLGLIVQKNGDGGDTLQRTGFFYLPGLIKGAVGARSCYTQEIEMLWGAEGPTRHIRQWPAQKEVSRDQLTPNVAALGFLGAVSKIDFLWAKLRGNWFRYPNGTDVASPEHIGIFLRAWIKSGGSGIFLIYPLLLLGDLFMLLGVVIRCIQAREPGRIQKWLGANVHWIFVAGEPPRVDGNKVVKVNDAYGPDNVGGDLNTLVSVVQAQYVCGTPISWLARKYYKRFRPMPFITLHGPMSTNSIFLALVWCCREESGGNPEIALAWKDLCDNL